MFILLDVRQAASTFHDSLAKISEKALSSGGTKRVILEKMLLNGAAGTRCIDVQRLFHVNSHVT